MSDWNLPERLRTEDQGADLADELRTAATHAREEAKDEDGPRKLAATYDRAGMLDEAAEVVEWAGDQIEARSLTQPNPEPHECDPEHPCEPNDHICKNYRKKVEPHLSGDGERLEGELEDIVRRAYCKPIKPPVEGEDPETVDSLAAAALVSDADRMRHMAGIQTAVIGAFRKLLDWDLASRLSSEDCSGVEEERPK